MARFRSRVPVSVLVPVITIGVVSLCVIFIAGLALGRSVAAAPRIAATPPSHQHATMTPIPYHPSHNPRYQQAASTATDWPEYGFDGSGARNNTSETILSAASVQQYGLTPVWSAVADPSSGRSQSLIVLGGNLYVAPGQQQVMGLNATTGAPAWSAPAEIGGIAQSLAGASGVVYIGGNDSWGYAVDAVTGASRGQHLYDDQFVAPLTILNGVIYTSVGGHYLDALNATNGNILWKVHLGAAASTAPAVVNGIVYAGAGDNRLYAVNASTGALVWDVIVLGGFATPTLPVVGGLVYVECSDGTLKAYNAATGALQWSIAAHAFSYPIAVGNGAVFVSGGDPSSGNSGMFAYDAQTGQQRWFTPTNGGAEGPVVANGVLYFGTYLSTEYALDATTGATLWSTTLNGQVSLSPIVVNGTLYVSLYGVPQGDPTIYAYQLT